MDIDGYTPFYMMLLLLCHEWFSEYVTCSAILGLLDKDDDLRQSPELLNTEIIL